MKNYKINIFCAVLIFAGSFLFAFGGNQIKEYTLTNGIPVYVMENTNNQIDSVCIGVKGGTSYYTKELSGIENAVFKMLLTGSAEFSKNDMQNEVYSTSSRYRASSLREGSILSLVSMNEYLEETLPLLLDGFVNPLFEQKEYENLINEYQSGLQRMLNDPLSMAFYYAKQVLYENHPYSTGAGVSPESLPNITLSAIKEYYASMLNSKRIFVVAVTSFDNPTLISMLQKYLGNIPAGEDLIEAQEMPELDFNQKPLVLTHASATGTGYVIRTYNAAGFKDEDYIAQSVAESIYSQVMHSVIRAKYGACYSAEAADFSDSVNAGCEYLYRCSDFTDLKERMAEAREIVSRGEYVAGTNSDGSFIYRKISDDFENFVNSKKNSMYSSLATTASLASTMCTSLLIWDDLTSLDEQRNRINTVSVQDVQAAFEKYINKDGGFWIAAVGPENEELLEEILSK